MNQTEPTSGTVKGASALTAAATVVIDDADAWHRDPHETDESPAPEEAAWRIEQRNKHRQRVR